MTNYGYMRVSTDDQMYDLQRNALIASGIDPENIYADTISGKTLQRPELSRLQEQLKPGDTFTVWKLDRLGRSLGNLIHMIDEFNKNGVHFRSLTEQLDTTTPTGKCMFHVVGAFAQLEREVISQRTKEGLAATKAKGTKLGRPPCSPDKMKKILELAKDPKMSVRKIAVKVWVSPAVVQRALEPVREELGRPRKEKGPPRPKPATPSAASDFI